MFTLIATTSCTVSLSEQYYLRHVTGHHCAENPIGIN